jgi:hypothetical protein
VLLVEAGATHDASTKEARKRKPLESAAPATKGTPGNSAKEETHGASIDMFAADNDANDPITKKNFTVNKEPVEQALLRFLRTKECRRVVLDCLYNMDIPPPAPHCDGCDIPPVTGNCGRCDICKPELLLLLDVNKQPHAPRKVIIKIEPLLDGPLKTRLVEWRETKYRNDYNGSLFSGEVLLGDLQISQICALARDSKLRVAEDVRRLVDWCFAGEYGQEILVIVHELYPLMAVEGSADTTTEVCSACHNPGHVGE